VVAITRDHSTPSESESATPAETVEATWTDATGAAADTTAADIAAADSGAANASEPSEPSKTDAPGESV